MGHGDMWATSLPRDMWTTSLTSSPALAALARECKGCLGTPCKGCHGTEQNEGRYGPREMWATGAVKIEFT